MFHSWPALPARRAPGQSLVLVALLMPVLIALVLVFLEIGTRLLQRAEAEDALRHASRSAISDVCV